MPNLSLDGTRRRLGRALLRGAGASRSVRTTLSALWVSGLAVMLGCSGEEIRPQPLPAEPPAAVTSVSQALAGKDGPVTILAATQQVVNRYAAVAADVKPGDKSIRVTGLNTLNVSAGDLLMVIQMQGATLDFTDTVTYGEVINYNGAGRYEFVTVTGTDTAAGAVQVDSCGGGVRNAYSAAAHTQVVRVPQYTTLTVQLAGSIIAPAWNGSVGGIVAVHAQNSVSLSGNIDVSARGFRPGLLDNLTTDPNMSMPIFRSTNAAAGGEKGEGIGGYSADYDASGGRYGRGAPGNGGGAVLQRTGMAWKTITNTSTANLRAAAIGLGASPNTYFVGDNGTALSLSNNGNSVSSKNTGTTTVLYGLSENPNGGKDDLYITGAISNGRGYARSWDGNGSFQDQMTGATNIPGNIYAMLCGITYHYAAGDGGMIVRRPSAPNNSDKWMASPSGTTQILRGLWASADNNIYAVGDAGTILQFDGASWIKVVSNTSTNLRAVWGSSFNNIYAVGEGGVVLHYLP